MSPCKDPTGRLQSRHAAAAKTILNANICNCHCCSLCVHEETRDPSDHHSAIRACWRRRARKDPRRSGLHQRAIEPIGDDLHLGPSLLTEIEKYRNPGSIRTAWICLSRTSGVTRSNVVWRAMHSREEILPPCHAASTSRHTGSAKRSRRRSVGSSGAIVPSKSTKTHNRRAFLSCIS